MNVFSSMFTFIVLKIYKYISIRSCNLKLMKEMVSYSIPLVPNSISWAIINLSDRFFITSVCGFSANGVYSMANKFPTVMDTIYGFFYVAWKESAAKVLKDKDVEEFYNNIYSTLKKFMGAMVLGIIAFLPLVFPLLIKKEFAEAYAYIPPLIVAMYFSNMSGYLGGIFSAYKNTKIMGITTVIASVINLIIDILLINYLGIWAGVISTCVATLLVYILRTIKIRKYLYIKDLYNKKLIPMLILVILLYYCNDYMIQVIGAIIITLYSLYMNSELIITILCGLKKKLRHKNV